MAINASYFPVRRQFFAASAIRMLLERSPRHILLRALFSIHGRRKKPLGNKLLKTAHDDAKAKARRAQLAANFPVVISPPSPIRAVPIPILISFTSLLPFTSL